MDKDQTRRLLYALIAAQFFTFFVLNFVEFGFVFPAANGLTWNHAMFVVLIYAATFIVGIGISLWQRWWRAVACQLGLPVAIMFLAFACYNLHPRNQKLDASRYQDLVGKTRDEVDVALGGIPPRSYGVDSDGCHVCYRGMRVRYNVVGSSSFPEANDRVTAVEPTP